jgi:hypothetical protein
MGVFLTEKQKSVSFLVSAASNLIRNLKLHIIFSPKTLTNDTHSLKMENYERVFSHKFKKHIISRFNGQQFDTQSEFAYYFLTQNPYK